LLNNLFNNQSKTAFIVNVGDEYSHVTYLLDGKIIRNWYLEAEIEDFDDQVKSIFSLDKKAKVYLLINSLEQFYKNEKLPVVNKLNQRKMINKKLQMSFSDDLCKVAVAGDFDETGHKRDYIFAGIAYSDDLKRWLGISDKLHNPFGGIYLLPLEAMKINSKLAGRASYSKGEHKWSLLLIVSGDGSLRHIINKNGKMVLTRLTSNIMRLNNTDLSEQVQKDIKNTLGYVKRMGYMNGDNLDINFLVPATKQADFANIELEEATAKTYTPKELGTAIGLNIKEETDTDAIIAAWFINNSNFRNHVSFDDFDENDFDISIPPKAINYGICVLCALFVLGGLKTTIAEYMSYHKDSQLLHNADEAINNVESISNPELIKIAHVEKNLTSQVGSEYFETWLKLDKILGASAKVVSLRYKKNTIDNSDDQWGDKEIRIEVEMMPDLYDISKAMDMAYEIKKRLGNDFAKTKVLMIKAPLNMLPEDTYSGKLGSNTSRSEGSAPYRFAFEIKGEE